MSAGETRLVCGGIGAAICLCLLPGLSACGAGRQASLVQPSQPGSPGAGDVSVQALPPFPGSGQRAAQPSAPDWRAASDLGPVESAPDDGIYGQNGVSFNADSTLMEYQPDGGLAWIIYERRGIDSDFYPDRFWIDNNGEPHWLAIANFSSGSWELYEGRHQYYLGDTLKGGKTSLLHNWKQYANTDGSFYLAVLSQSPDLETGMVGVDMEYAPLDPPTGLHVESTLFYQLNIAWDSYSDPRDLRLILKYIQDDGKLRTKTLAESATSNVLVLYDHTEFCLQVRWPEKGIDGPESPWVIYDH